MPVTVVVGGQFGSEGKGKVAHWFARHLGASTAVRVGGTNPGHTVITRDGVPIIFKQLPTAAILPDVVCVLPAGSYIAPKVLRDEIALTHLSSHRLVIDPNAIVITDRELADENASGLRSSIGSTLSGTGAAVVARLRRDGKARRAREEPLLEEYIRPAAEYLRSHLAAGERLIVEGTQGFGLSVLHSPHYPFATSRDTTAAGCVMESGLSPLDVDDVILVIRAFPIRVAGNSGPLPSEISWDDVTRESGRESAIIEHTSVTRSVRRVARFDPSIVRQALIHNQPTRLVLNHLDYVDMSSTEGQWTSRTKDFVRNVESGIGAPVDYIGLGPANIESVR